MASDSPPPRRRFLTGRIHGELPVWRQVPTTGANPNDVLWGVWCDGSDHALIVGDGGAVHRLKDGAWRREESGVKEPLHAVVGFGDDNAVAVGWMGVIVHWYDIGWRRHGGGIVDPITKRYAQSRANTPLFGLWASAPGDVWAVGDEGRVCHFDGTGWHEIDCPTDAHLRAVVRLRGGAWTALASDEPLPRLRAVERIGDAVIAIGDHGAVTRVEGHRTVTEQVETRRDLYGLAAAGGQRALCVGDGGVAIERTTISATALPSLEADATPVGRASPWEAVDGCPTDRVLWSVWGSDSQVVAVGDEGAIVAFDGQRWRAHSAPSPLHLHGVWGRRADLYGVHGRALDDIVVVGLSGATAHFDGRRWSRRITGTTADLLGVAPLDDTRWLAVGTRGTALVWDGSAWIEEDTGTDAGLRAVWVDRGGTAYAVGDGGTVRKRLP